jgi:hypothetical protein
LPVIAVVISHLNLVLHVMWFQLLADSVNQQPQLFLVKSNVIQPQQLTQPQPQLQQQRQPVIHVPEFVLEVVDVRDCVSTGTMKLVLLGF